ncbi:hypothetical protein TraAM80_03216 [Trypanosoma rangeli]|uniref:Uncharacterized protein n=1 Tax=Trypanosoma rangeli TaxID=5698 RepID=A0A422NQK6_TRYRA|nr:uncharacterized protein TraAM80_03216 [Trypanosoma rangeli]RNF07694.1 hypothetical protein TraAM80_03216 [Trypanosoma rangeli]|eukprot:RNF07694.1 hypothetical protein TraAM80_03216 [Trypanosoma rangeli]
MAFAGYDMETAEILLKDLLGVSYRLQPTWKICGRSNEIIQSGNDDDDVVEEFTESECSASYVSSASIYTCSEDGDGVPIEDGVPKEIVKAGGTECDRNASCVHDLGSTVPPVHGTLLMLREIYTGDKANLPIVSPCTEIAVGDLESLHTVIVLGYSENGDVLLLPMPRVVSEGGVCMYRCLPALQLSLMKLYEYYDCLRKADGDANRDTPSFKLPLREDAMTCPHLEQTPLRQVYNVSTDRVYYLSAWKAYVQFVGAAWGVPWLRVFSVEVATGNTGPACGEEANAFSCIKPLCSCHGERQLCELYGLCEWVQTTQTPDAVTAPVLPIADAVGEENWKSFWQHIQWVSEASLQFTSGGDSLASPPLPFTPRKWQRVSEVNPTDGGAVSREPSLLPHGSKQNCTAASDVATNYDVTAGTLEPFGVLHGDHLVGMSGTSFEGRVATVLGVHMGRLLLRLDGDQEETVLSGVEGKDKLMSLFAKISAPKLDDQVKREIHSPDTDKSTSLPPVQCDGKFEGISNFDRSFAGSDAGDGDKHPFVLLEEEAAQAASEGRWGGNESTMSDGEIAPQSLFLTSFLKAVAYWKMQLFSEEDQRQQPLAFVEYYGTDSQRRMLEAVDLLQRHKSFFASNTTDCSADAHVCLSASQHAGEGRPMRVHRIVQLLVENETGECR